ncbi:MAG TPA: PD-(D/E)XK nuclease superfamily protein, partial [Nitrososphaeraceae archaeon]
SLEMGGYLFEVRKNIGLRPTGRRHYVDVVARKDNQSILISSKWQQVGGTVEQKIPFEVICLIEALKNITPKFDKAYIVLGGEGMSIRDFYINGGLNKYIPDAIIVNIVTLEKFVSLSNRGML